MKKPVNLFWFRRDLRLSDNAGLYHALRAENPVLPLFIYDDAILKNLPKEDARVSFIHAKIDAMNKKLQNQGSTLIVKKGRASAIFKELAGNYNIKTVFSNEDYEPYAIQRDSEIEELLSNRGIDFKTFKDQVIFGRDEVVKNDGKPYTVFTPFSRRWLERFDQENPAPFKSEKQLGNFGKMPFREIPSLEEIGFVQSHILIPAFDLSKELLENYSKNRDYPAIKGTSHLGPHLRFGTVGIREIVNTVREQSPVFLNELIWREFFMQILWHFPGVVDHAFKPIYDKINWINDGDHFKRWCEGSTGFPLVDAGMRELNTTGYMHNRVRMVVASFLTKDLLTDWRWGEAYFAEKLLDFELSSNNGNWQWAAGTGCDAAPYFRIFNPIEQQKKYDPDMRYIKKWVPEIDTSKYPKPIVDHKIVRERALKVYKLALKT